jgi:hypothetical protein
MAKPKTNRRIADGKGRKNNRGLIVTQGEAAEARRKEEEIWASKSGPVTIRKIGDPK